MGSLVAVGAHTLGGVCGGLGEGCVVEDALGASEEVLECTLGSDGAAAGREDRVLCLFDLLTQFGILAGHHKTRLILHRLADLNRTCIVAHLSVRV